jgi:hypothetical protein
MKVHPRFAAARELSPEPAGALPDITTIEELINTAFWASLRREEGYVPKISLAFLPPESAGSTLTFERPLRLDPEILVRLAAAAERPGIHLGVWRDREDLFVWGATRMVPALSFVLEVVAPGLLVIKHRRGEASAKFVNVAVLEADQVKVVDLDAASLAGCPNGVSSLLGAAGDASGADSMNALVELAVSMRAHGRGGALLVVPAAAEAWRESMVQPIHYSISPPFSRMAGLMCEEPARGTDFLWQEAFHRTVETIAGLTSVDGATVINDRYEVLAFGAKIRRHDGRAQIEHVLLTEPIEGAARRTVTTAEMGGTRHLSAAQFAHDQRDAAAMVASQDGRFTLFGWSPCDEMVEAHRVETLLL